MMMDELKKAKALLSDRNIKLTDLAEKTNIPYESLRTLRYDLSKVDKASWERVHTLALTYDLIPGNKKVVKKPLMFETNKYIYVEKADAPLKEHFSNIEEVTLNWQKEERLFWKIELTEDNFNAVFDRITLLSDDFEYRFVDTDSLEGKNARKLDIYNVYFYLPFYDWGMFDNYIANWLIKQLTEDKANLQLTNMANLSEGLNAISKPLYKYVFSLMADKETRREGLIDSALLLDDETSLTYFARMAHIKMHANERDPRPNRKPFDPDAYIKGNLESVKEPFDPDDMAY